MKLLTPGDAALPSSVAHDTRNSARVLSSARSVLTQQADAIQALAARLDARFVHALDCLLAIEGRVIMTGVGKSGIIARKIAATLASTGTPSFFLHATEALHGDLGMVTSTDAVVFISGSGETHELLALLPHVKRRGVLTLAIVGHMSSSLATGVDLALDVAVPGEACPLGLAPTTSTLAALAMGDALALGLMDARGFGPADFARHHPGGSLGQRLAPVDQPQLVDSL